MYGISKILETVLKSQRLREDLIIPSEVHSVPPILPSQYSSPLECPTSVKCGECDKISGTLNALQSTWIKTNLNQFKQDGHKNIPLWIYPPTPKWSMRPDVHDYLLKPLSIWHPERQLGISICSQKCPTCQKQGYLRFKEYSLPRHVHDLQYDCYFTSTVYICATKNGCGATFSIMDEDVVFKNNIIPYEAFLQCPVQVFHTTAWTTSLVQSMYDLTTSRAGINDFIAMVKKARTSYFMLQSLAWKGHIDYYNGVVQGHSYTILKETFPDFPMFFQHCNGFNGTSGPSRQIATSIFEAITSQQKKFFQRFEGGLIGSHLAADHHHNVPARIQIDDPTTGQKFAPIDGLFVVMNERHQIIAHRWTNSTTNEERTDLAKELKLRYSERSQNIDPVMYLDKCCDDCQWFLQAFPQSCILLDNFHLITRYRDNSNATDKSRHSLFMNNVSKIIIGHGSQMQEGSIIYAELSAFIESFQKFELHLPASKRIIGEPLIRCHETQKKHFMKCLNPPVELSHEILDRFFRRLLRRGSSRNENFWRHLRASFPESCGISFGDALTTALVCGWNFRGEVQFNDKWAYLPISTMHIILTQDLALRSRSNLSSTDGVCTMFCPLPLSLHDCDNEFGITNSYFHSLPTLPTLPHVSSNQQTSLNAGITSLVDYAIWDSHTFDPIAEQVVNATQQVHDRNLDLNNHHIASNEEDHAVPRTVQTNIGNPLKRQRIADVHVHGSTSSHKKRSGSLNTLGNHRFSAFDSLALWDSVMGLSPMFNPLERRVLRFLAMHCFTEEPLSNLKDFPLQGFNYNALFRVWDVCISAIRQSDFSFKAYLRPKPLQSLKQQLLDMIAMVQFQTTFQTTVRTSSIINTLHTTTSHLREEAQVVQDIGASHVIHEQENVGIPDITSIPFVANVLASTSRYSTLSPDEALLAMVKDEQIVSKSIRWKVSIMPQWNALASKGTLGFFTYSHEQLRRRYKYLQTQLPILPSSNSDVVGDIYQNITKEIETQDESEIVADLPTSLPLVDLDSLQISRSESIYEPPLCSQLPSLKDIDSAIVPSAAKGTPYSEKETQLFSYLLHHQNEKKHIKPNKRSTVDWEKFAIRWKYYCQVESCLGNSNFLIRDQFQLKQKKKDEDKRGKQKM